VRGNIIDEPTHIHFDTGNNQYYNQYIGDDNKYILLANTGNIIINSNDAAGNSAQWIFNTAGTLTLPGGDAAIVPDLGGTTSFQGAANTGVVVTSSGNAGSVIMSWVDQITDQANARTASMTLNAALDATALIQVANLAANAVSNWKFDSTGNLTLPGNTFAVNYANGDPVTVSGGNATLPLANGTSNFDIATANGNVTIVANASSTWTFGTNSTLTLPGGSQIRPLGANLDISSNGGYVNLITADESSYMGVSGNGGFITTAGGTWQFDATGNLTAPGNISAVGNITGAYVFGNGSQLTGITANTANITSNVISFNTAAGINVAAGQMAWNSSDGTLDIGLSYADVVLQVGQETHYVVRNDTGNIIENGTAVYCSGVTAGSGRIEASPMMGNIDPVQFLGLATQDINNGVNGVVTYFGYVRGLDTRGTANTAISVGDETWAVGDKLYVHPTAPGKLTKFEPAAPNVKICVASIMTRNQTSGVVFVRPTSNLDMVDLSDVQITTPATNQFLVYVGNRWENTALDISLDTTPTLGGNLAGAGFNVSNVGNISATGNITGGNIVTAGNVSGNTAGFAIGYRDIPQVSFTANTTIATTDAGKHYYSTLSTGNVLTIANNASQGFQVGAAITVVNQGTGNITVAQGSGVTLYLAGNATSGNRTVATFGMATLIKVATDTWFINGTGVS
jgi:hypothetical protein